MEIELKWGLRYPGDLERLLANLPEPHAVLVQQNHYFTDTNGELARTRTMVRIREQGRSSQGCTEVSDIVLTVKRRLNKEAGVFRAEETEESISEDLWRDILYERTTLDVLESPALHQLQSSLSLGAWQPQGVLTNKRHVVKLEGFVLEIDRTTFDHGHVDVEVEVETEDIDGAKALLTRIGDECDITFFEQTRGKYSRFLSRCLEA